MKNLLKAEELLQLILCIYLSLQLPYPGWLYWALFLAPDIGILGYLLNTKTGAVMYNIFHHKGIAIAFYIAGLLLTHELLQFIGLLLFGHSAFDRIFGYGLKFHDHFKHTHLGWLNRANEKE